MYDKDLSSIYLNICSETSDEVKQCSSIIENAIANHGMFQIKIYGVVSDHLKEINVLLQGAKTRNKGFERLLPLIQQGSYILLEKRCELWFNTGCHAIGTFCRANEKVNACRLIVLLLKAAPNIPEFHRSISTNTSLSLIQGLVAANSSWDCAALECLYEYIKLFPGPSLSQKALIEKNMLTYLDKPLATLGQEDAVKKAGQVYAVLPLPGMGGNKAQGRAEARGRLMSQLIALAHTTMDALFTGIVERESYSHARESNLKIPPIKFKGKTGGHAIRGYFAAVTRLGNTLKFLSEMLTSDSIESISLVPYDLLSPIFRLLQISTSVLRTYRSQEHIILTFAIPILHHHCLLLLRDLIVSIGESIDLYFGVIADLLLSVLKTTYEFPLTSTGGLQTRIIIYSVMSTVIQASRGRHAPSKELATLMAQDIMPKSEQVTLQKTASKGLASLTVKKTKKKKGIVVLENDKESQSGLFFQLDIVSRVSRSALALAETLFTHASHSLSLKTKQILQTNLINVAEAVTGSANIHRAYSHGKTRAQMYRTLASIATHPDPRCPPPYTTILYLLQQGQQDQQMLVVTTCQALIGNVSFILANPQLSDMALAQANLKSPKEEGMEEDIADTFSAEVISDKLEDDEDSDQDDEDMEEDDEKEEEEKVEEEEEKEEVEEEEDEEEEEEETEEEEEEEEAVNSVDVSQSKSTESDKIKNGDIVFNGQESDEELEEETHNENGEEDDDSEEITVPVLTPIVKAGKKTKKTNTATPKTVAKVASTATKRKQEEESSSSSKRNKKGNKKAQTSRDGPSIEEMLSSFVNAPPDDE